MSLTAPNQFKEFLTKLSPTILGNTWFFPLRPDKKNPDVPSGAILKQNTTYRLKPAIAYQRLRAGGNVGIYALTGGLLFIDLDVSNGKLKASQSFLDSLESTLRIKTRNGGYQLYYQNDGTHQNQVIFENGLPIGELRCDWYYVVSVGSHVPHNEQSTADADGTYRIDRSIPIAPFRVFGEYFTHTVKQEPARVPRGIQTASTIDVHREELRTAWKVRRKISPTEIKFILARRALDQ